MARRTHQQSRLVSGLGELRRLKLFTISLVGLFIVGMLCGCDPAPDPTTKKTEKESQLKSPDLKDAEK